MLKSEPLEGVIVKGVSGFYSVEAGGVVYTCKARGLFRKNDIAPMVGDHVKLAFGQDASQTIGEILPRRNFLVRPPVANIDQLLIVVSVCEPSPSPLIIDKTIAAAEDKGIEPVLVFSKTDLQDDSWLREIYATTGIAFFSVSSATGMGVEPIRALLAGKVTALTGNTGAGKSSLLNCIFPAMNRSTGEISQRLGRGRHTTREVELLPLAGGGYVADTPGFSLIQLEHYNMVNKDNLQFCFREFKPYLGRCRFPSCAHTCEKGCAVLGALRAGTLSESRHESYLAMYREVKDIKEWDR